MKKRHHAHILSGLVPTEVGAGKCELHSVLVLIKQTNQRDVVRFSVGICPTE